MASNLEGFTWKGPQFKHLMEPTKGVKERRKAAKQSALDAAYETVNTRDGNKSRVTGLPLDPRASTPKHRREHHHLRGRNAAPELREDPANIILCSTLEHEYLTKEWLVVEGTDANKPLRFHWAEHVPMEKRIFRIQSRRRSQQREKG